MAVFIWIGFLGAISFMEAWLKFQAPGITIPLGLGIGRLVFFGLNKVEILLSFVIIMNLLFGQYNFKSRDFYFILLPIIILILQTIWLLPSLDARAELILEGQSIPKSNLHFYYVGMEVIKLICLFIFGHTLFKSFKGKE